MASGISTMKPMSLCPSLKEISFSPATFKIFLFSAIYYVWISFYLFYFLVLGLNSGLHACEAGILPFESLHQS
jgi:hypothetical protein